MGNFRGSESKPNGFKHHSVSAILDEKSNSNGQSYEFSTHKSIALIQSLNGVYASAYVLYFSLLCVAATTLNRKKMSFFSHSSSRSDNATNMHIFLPYLMFYCRRRRRSSSRKNLRQLTWASWLTERLVSMSQSPFRHVFYVCPVPCTHQCTRYRTNNGIRATYKSANIELKFVRTDNERQRQQRRGHKVFSNERFHQ